MNWTQWRCNALSLFSDWLNYAVRSSGDAVLNVRLFTINNENRTTKNCLERLEKTARILNWMWPGRDLNPVRSNSDLPSVIIYRTTYIMCVPDYTASQQWNPTWELRSSYIKFSTVFYLFILGARSITSVILHATIYIHFLHFCYFMFVFMSY